MAEEKKVVEQKKGIDRKKFVARKLHSINQMTDEAKKKAAYDRLMRKK